MAAITTNANSIKGYKVSISSPADGDVLTYVAANGDIENKAASGGGGGSSAPYYTIHFPLIATTEVNNVSSGGAISTVNGGLRGTQNTPTSGEYGAWYNQLSASWFGDTSGLGNSYGQIILDPVSSAGSGIQYFHFFSQVTDGANVTSDHVGYQFEKVSGTTTIYSSSSNGTTQQKVSVSGVTLDFGDNLGYRYGFKYDGTTVSFYVNGVLKNTHSTNVPRLTSSQAYNYINIYKSTVSSNNAFYFIAHHFNLLLGITS